MEFEPKETDNIEPETDSVEPETGSAETETGSRPEDGTYEDPNAGARYTYGTTEQTASYYGGSGTYGSYGGPNDPDQDSGVMPLGEWLLVIIAGAIPCVGLVIYLVWAFGNTGNLNRRNYCRASLIIQIVSVIVGILFVVFFLTAGAVLYVH